MSTTLEKEVTAVAVRAVMVADRLRDAEFTNIMLALTITLLNFFLVFITFQKFIDCGQDISF